VTQYQGAPTLYFGPDQTGAGRALNLTYVPPSNSAGSSSGNFKSMSFSRSQTVVKGITVTVQSAGRDNPTVRKSYPTAPKGTSPGKASPYGATTNYVTSIASGATPAQCLARAVSIYNEIIRHAMKIKVRLPADEITTVTGKLVVTGTRTSFDQTYYPRSITRTFSVSEGFSMDIDAQSYSPNLLIE
jgi:hypothetical protein